MWSGCVCGGVCASMRLPEPLCAALIWLDSGGLQTAASLAAQGRIRWVDVW